MMTAAPWESNIRAVLFDLDNTLADRFGAFRSWVAWFVPQVMSVSDSAQFEAICAELIAVDAGGYTSRAEFARYVLERFPGYAESTAVFVRSFQQQIVRHLPPVTEADAAFLDHLKSLAIPWGIVTNGGPNQANKIAQLGLTDAAKVVIISDVVGVKKPDPQIFQMATEAIGVLPEHTLFVGDNPAADIVGAAKVGMKTAWLHHGVAWSEAWSGTQPDLIIGAVGDLISLNLSPH